MLVWAPVRVTTLTRWLAYWADSSYHSAWQGSSRCIEAMVRHLQPQHMSWWHTLRTKIQTKRPPVVLTAIFQFPFLQNFSLYTLFYNKLAPGDISTIQIMPPQPGLQDTLLSQVFREPHLSRSCNQDPTSKPSAPFFCYSREHILGLNIFVLLIE